MARNSVRAHTRAVLLLALLARAGAIAFNLTHLPPGWFFTKGQEMHLLAASLVQGHGLSSPFGPPTGPTAMIAPAYPIFVAAIFGVFGIRSLASAIAIMVLQALLSLATVWLLLHLSRRLASETGATLVGAFYALSLPQVWMPTIFWETSFSTFFLLAAVALSLRATPQTSSRAWVGGGAAIALAGLFNPALLPSLIALAVLIAWVTQSGVRKPLLAAVAFTLVFAAWPLRNALTFHAFIPTRTTVGFELWMGNRPGADGFLNETLFPTFNAAELAAYRTEGEFRYMATKAALARTYIERHPEAFLRLTLRRTLRYWAGEGTRNAPAIFALHALTTTLFGVAGLFVLRRSRAALFFVIPLALFPLPYCITHAEFRYRLVLDPVLCVLSAVALDAVALAVRNRSPVPLAVSVRRNSLT